MRLEQIETGLGPLKRLVLRVIGVIMGEEPPDILKLALYRSRFFAKPFEAINKKLLRGPSDWSVAEREMFAAFVSRQNQCAFCIGSHSALAARALDDQSLVRAVLDDWRTAPVDARLKATLGFLEKLNAHPDKVTAKDIDALRTEGIGDEAIRDVIYICSQFNIINRIVDALDLSIPSEQAFTRFAARSLRHAQFATCQIVRTSCPWTVGRKSPGTCRRPQSGFTATQRGRRCGQWGRKRKEHERQLP